MTTPDRVSFSYGLTVPGPEQYSSRRFDVSVATDVRPGESPEQALERAKAFVHAQADAEMPRAAPAFAPALAGAEMPRAAPAPTGLRRAPVQDEPFDPSNPVHLRIAQAVLDTAGVRSEAARNFKINRLLKGKPISDLAMVVAQDMEAYRMSQAGRSGKRWP